MPLPIRKPQLISTIHILTTQRADMGREDDILGLPQGVVFGQGLGIRHVQRRSREGVVVQGFDQRGLVNDGPARDVDDECALLAVLARRLLVGRIGAQERELVFSEEVAGAGCQGQGDDESI